MRGRKHKKPVTQAEIFHSSSEEAYFDTQEVKKLPQIKDFALTQNQYLMIMCKLPKMFSLQPVKNIQKSRKLLSEIIDKPSQREDSQKKQQQKQKNNMIRRETSKMTINSNQSWEIDEHPSVITYNGLEPDRSEQQKIVYYDLQKSNQEQEPSLPHNKVCNTSSVAVPQNQSQNISEFQKQADLNPIQQAEPCKKQEKQQVETEKMQQILNVRSKRGRKSRLKPIDAASKQFNVSTSREHKSIQKQLPPQTVWTTREQQAYRQKLAQEYHILKALKQHPHIQPFMLPVDEVKDGAPGYLAIIKKPMDLSTIENKLKNHVYQNCNQFHSDVEQMWENSHIYNRPKSAMTKLTFQLQKTYKNLKQVYGNKKEGIENKRGRRI